MNNKNTSINIIIDLPILAVYDVYKNMTATKRNKETILPAGFFGSPEGPCWQTAPIAKSKESLNDIQSPTLFCSKFYFI